MPASARPCTLRCCEPRLLRRGRYWIACSLDSTVLAAGDLLRLDATTPRLHSEGAGRDATLLAEDKILLPKRSSSVSGSEKMTLCETHPTSWHLQVLDAVRPAEDEIVLPKGSSSVFGSTNIGYLLRNMVRLLKRFGARFS